MRKWLLITGSSLAVAACGGGGTSSAPVASATPAAAPTPTPAPTPAPTPTPTPAPGYPRYVDLTGNRTFQTACASVLLGTALPSPQPAVGLGDGLVLDSGTTGTWAVSGDGVALSYAASDSVAAPSGQRIYEKNVGGSIQRLTFTDPTASGTVSDYTRRFSLRTDRSSGSTLYSCVFGVPTTLADRPTAAVTYGKVAIDGTAYLLDPSGAVQAYSISASTGTVSYDATANALVISIKLVGNLQTSGGTSATAVDLGTFTGSGAVDSSLGKLSGQLDSVDRISLFSSFGGWFFGSTEAASAFEILAADPTSGARISVVGTVAAAR